MKALKVGDFVIDKNKKDAKPFLLKYDSEIGSYVNEECELWQPKECELILAHDRKKIYLVQFIGMYEKRYVCRHIDGFSETFCCIEPFIGELPSFIKD